jgi:hypothetical protein
MYVLVGEGEGKREERGRRGGRRREGERGREMWSDVWRGDCRWVFDAFMIENMDTV